MPPQLLIQAARSLAVELRVHRQSGSEDDFGGQRAPALTVELDLDPAAGPAAQRGDPWHC
jgi:hypothetical protein